MTSILIARRTKVSGVTGVAGVARGAVPVPTVVLVAGRGVAVSAVLVVLSITGSTGPISVMVSLLSGRDRTIPERKSLGLLVAPKLGLFQVAASSAVLFLHLGNLGTMLRKIVVEFLNLGVDIGFLILNGRLISLDPGVCTGLHVVN